MNRISLLYWNCFLINSINIAILNKKNIITFWVINILFSWIIFFNLNFKNYLKKYSILFSRAMFAMYFNDLLSFSGKEEGNEGQTTNCIPTYSSLSLLVKFNSLIASDNIITVTNCNQEFLPEFFIFEIIQTFCKTFGFSFWSLIRRVRFRPEILAVVKVNFQHGRERNDHDIISPFFDIFIQNLAVINLL